MGKEVIFGHFLGIKKHEPFSKIRIGHALHALIDLILLAGRSILLLAGRPICDRFWLAAGWILLRSRAALLLMLAWGASGSNAAAAVIMNTCTHVHLHPTRWLRHAALPAAPSPPAAPRATHCATCHLPPVVGVFSLLLLCGAYARAMAATWHRCCCTRWP
jgi:hypothetical protein